MNDDKLKELAKRYPASGETPTSQGGLSELASRYPVKKKDSSQPSELTEPQDPPQSTLEGGIASGEGFDAVATPIQSEILVQPAASTPPPFATGKNVEEYISFKRPETVGQVPLSTNYQMYQAAGAGDYETATKIANEQLKNNPKDPYATRIAYYTAKKQGTATGTQLDQALQLNPGDIPMLADKALQAVNTGDDQLAVEAAGKILLEIPSDTRDLAQLGYRSYALSVLAGTVQKVDPTKTRAIVIERMKNDALAEEVKASQEPPTTAEYIMSNGLNNSMIGMIMRGGLPKGSTDSRYDRFADYEPTFAEEVGAGVVSIFADLPFFGIGGGVGSAIGSAGVKGTTKLVLNSAYKQMLKKGATKEAADAMIKEVAKGVSKSGWAQAANMGKAMAETSQALGVYGAMRDATEQVVNEDRPIDQINYESVLNEYGEQSILGLAVGGIGYGTAMYNRALTSAVESATGRSMSAAAKAAKTAVVHTGGFAAENAAFIYGGKALKGEPISATGKEWAASVITLGALKGYGLIKGFIENGYARPVSDEPIETIRPDVKFTPEELRSMNETANGMGLVNSLRTNPEKLETVMRDPEVPLIAKLKIMYGMEGVRPDAMPRAERIDIAPNGDVFTMDVRQADGTLITRSDYPTMEAAEQARMNMFANIKDRNEQEFSSGLPGPIKNQVVENLKAEGFDFDLKIKAAETLPADRTPEQVKAIQRFNDEVQRVFTEDQKKQEAEAVKKGITDGEKPVGAPQVPATTEDPQLGVKEGIKASEALDPIQPVPIKATEDNQGIPVQAETPSPEQPAKPLSDPVYTTSTGANVYNEGRTLRIFNQNGEEIPHITKRVSDKSKGVDQKRKDGTVKMKNIYNPEFVKAKNEYIENFPYDNGKDFPEPIESLAPNEGDWYVVENTENPQHLIDIYQREADALQFDREGSNDWWIAENLGYVTQKSFDRWMDSAHYKDKGYKAIKIAYFRAPQRRTDVKTLDQVAQAASMGRSGSTDDGESITPEMVGQFIIDHPSGVESYYNQKSNIMRDAENRFADLTGLPLNKKVIEAARSQANQKRTPTEQQQQIAKSVDEELINILNDPITPETLPLYKDLFTPKQYSIVEQYINHGQRYYREEENLGDYEMRPTTGEGPEVVPGIQVEQPPVGDLAREYADRIKQINTELTAERKRNNWLKNKIAQEQVSQGDVFDEGKPEPPPADLFGGDVEKDFSKENIARIFEDSNGKIRRLQDERLDLERKRDQVKDADENQHDVFEDREQGGDPFDDWLNSWKTQRPLDEPTTMGVGGDALWNDFIDAIRDLRMYAKEAREKIENLFDKLEDLIRGTRNSDWYRGMSPKDRSKIDRDINDIRDKFSDELSALYKEREAGSAENFTERTRAKVREIGDMNPLEFPEILRMAEELGAFVRAKNLRPNQRGRFVVDGKEIDLSYELFEPGNEAQLAQTMAHELGHLTDFLSEGTLSRGNILGRIATLHHFMKEYLPYQKGDPGELTPEDIIRLTKEAKKTKDQVVEKEIDEEIVTRTGLDPQDVLAVWNSVTGTKVKALEEYIKGLDTPQIKSIIKQAMQGKIADELKGFVSEQRTKTGKKIKITEIIKGNWKDKLQELIMDEVKRRKLWNEHQMFFELYEFGKKWRPFDEARATPSFIKYRRSSKELYADAISGLVVDPSYFREQAPAFYEAFFKYIDSKPEFADAYLGLQDFVRDPIAVKEARLNDLYDGFDAARAKLRDIVTSRKKTNELCAWNKFVSDFVSDIAVAVKGIPRKNDFGVRLSPRHKVRNDLEMLQLIDNETYIMAETFRNEIWGALEQVGVSSNEFDALLMTARQMADRANKPNPRGWQGNVNADMEAYIKAKFSPEQAMIVDQVTKRFHSVVFDYVSALRDQGAFTDRQWTEDIEPHKDTYATYWVVDYITDTFIPAGIKQVTGTMRQVASPSLATAIKMASVARLTTLQRAKNSMIEGLREYDPENIKDGVPKKDRLGRPTGEFHAIEGMKPIMYYKEGVWSAVMVDPWIADVFERLDPPSLDIFTRVAGFFNQGFKPIVTKYNPGFAFVTNIIRDYKQSTAAVYSIFQADKATRNVIGDLFYVPLRMLAGYPVAVYRGAKMMKGNKYGNEKTQLTRFLSRMFYDPALIEEMLRVGAFSVKTGILNNYDPVVSENDALLFSKFGFGVYRLTGFDKLRARNQFFDFIGKLFDGYEVAAGAFEVGSKINAYTTLKIRIKDAKAIGFYTRNFTGTPNYNERGKKTFWTNTWFPFSNVIAQGLRTVSEIASAPKSAGAFWLYKTMWVILPAVATGLAEAGLFGEDLKKAYRKIGDYYNDNYLTIPIGEDKNGKVGFIPIPLDESSRVIHGVTKNLVKVISEPEYYTRNDARQILQVGAGMTPSISPLVSIAGNWFDFAVMGANPPDPHYGGYVVPQTKFTAGGITATLPMIDWTIKTAGLRDVTRIYSYDPLKNTTTEYTMSAIPGINRMVRFSNMGESDADQMFKEEARREQAKEKLRVQSILVDKVIQYNAGSDKSASAKVKLLKEAQKEMFPDGITTMEDKDKWDASVQKFNIILIKGARHPDTEVISNVIDSRSTEEKVAALKAHMYVTGEDDVTELLMLMVKQQILTNKSAGEISAALRK